MLAHGTEKSPEATKRRKTELVIQGIDVRAGLKRTGGNRRRYETLLRKFAEQQDGTSAAIGAALAKNDRATAERAAHSLKGAAATLGAMALSEAASRAEAAIKSGKDAGSELQALALSLDTVLARLRAALPDEARGNGAGTTAGNPANVWSRSRD